MSIDWSKAPHDAEAGFAGSPLIHSAWFRKDENGQVMQICPAAGVNRWLSMGGRKDFPVGSEMRPTTEFWAGEGLPPVGTVCEYNDLISSSWTRVKILAHFDNKVPVAVFIPDNDSQNKEVDQAIAECFRPIRTAEQIAAEERQQEVESALRAIDSILRFPPNSASGNIVGATVRAMLEAGYRKQEQK